MQSKRFGTTGKIVSFGTLIALVLVAWGAWAQTRSIEKNQLELLQKGVDSVSAEIELLLNERHNFVRAFAFDNKDIFVEMLANPEDYAAIDNLRARIQNYVPGFLAYTIYGHNGQMVPEPFGDIVGPQCQTDIENHAVRLGGHATTQGFLSSRSIDRNRPYIHPQPHNYHFDMMAGWPYSESAHGEFGVFFVSFRAQELSEILQHFERPGSTLVLMRDDIPNLIEVMAEGPRDILGRDIRLSDEELTLISVRKPIENSRWVLAGMLDQEYMRAEKNNVLFMAMGIEGAIVFFWLGSLMILHRSRTREKKAMDALQTSEDRYRQIAKISSDWVWEMDEDLRFSYFSDTFTPFTQIDSSRLLGRRREEITSPDDLKKPKWEKHLEDLRERREFKDFQYEFSVSGSQNWFFSISGSPVFDDHGQFLGYRGTGSNITEKVAWERALKEAKAEAESANQAKSDFLSSMSHELRTPLNAILGFSQLLESDPDHPLKDDQVDSVSHIKSSGEHLLRLINEVLDLAKIDAGKLNVSIQDIDPADSISSSIRIAVELGKKNNVKIDGGAIDCSSCQAPCRIQVDQSRFQQILLNLLSNAVKYNRENGKVIVTCERRDNGFMRFSVSDTGMGIPESRQKELFEPFQRLEAEGTDIEGTGIGLTITKKLVELMDGRIGFVSEHNHGSTFWVEFPLAGEVEETEPRTLDESKPEPEKETAGSATILYVEDNPANLMLMEKIFQRLEGLRLVSAHNAEMGIVVAEQERPDLILMDMNLPGMNGAEALKEIQASEQLKHIPVIAVSANAMPHDIESAMNLGFKDYITKPFQIDKIISSVAAALKGAAPSGEGA